jgi:hypothetical protein
MCFLCIDINNKHSHSVHFTQFRFTFLYICVSSKLQHAIADIDQQSYCNNCRRRHVTLLQEEGKKVRKCSRKTYCKIGTRKPILYLCNECSTYLKAGLQSCFWPAMIWSFLSLHHNSDRLEELSTPNKWRLIPIAWRGWWLEAMEAGDEIGINHPEPEFHDVTVDKLEFQHAIDTLRWISLGKAMDKYLAIPTVRCPWGCETYLHQTNMLPFEDFLLAQSNYSFRSASKCKQATRNPNANKPPETGPIPADQTSKKVRYYWKKTRTSFVDR